MDTDSKQNSSAWQRPRQVVPQSRCTQDQPQYSSTLTHCKHNRGQWHAGMEHTRGGLIACVSGRVCWAHSHTQRYVGGLLAGNGTRAPSLHTHRQRFGQDFFFVWSAACEVVVVDLSVRVERSK